MCKKENCDCGKVVLNNEELPVENLEENEEISDIDSRFVEIEIEKELDRLDSLIYFDEDTKQALVESNEFQKGISDSLLLCGMYSNFINFGIPEEKAYELTISHQISCLNLEMAKENNRASIEIAKNQVVAMEKTQL